MDWQEARELARDIITDHAYDIEFLTIAERTMNSDEANEVAALIDHAVVTVTWPAEILGEDED